MVLTGPCLLVQRLGEFGKLLLVLCSVPRIGPCWYLRAQRGRTGLVPSPSVGGGDWRSEQHLEVILNTSTRRGAGRGRTPRNRFCQRRPGSMSDSPTRPTVGWRALGGSARAVVAADRGRPSPAPGGDTDEFVGEVGNSARNDSSAGTRPATAARSGPCPRSTPRGVPAHRPARASKLSDTCSTRAGECNTRLSTFRTSIEDFPWPPMPPPPAGQGPAAACSRGRALSGDQLVIGTTAFSSRHSSAWPRTGAPTRGWP